MRWSGLYNTLRFQIIPKIVLVTEIDKRVFCDVTKKIGSTEVNKMWHKRMQSGKLPAIMSY